VTLKPEVKAAFKQAIYLERATGIEPA